MAYLNLRAEMARRGVMIKDLMEVTGKSRSAVSMNLNGNSEFSIGESIKIKERFFPDMDYEILFEKEEVIA